MKETDSGSALGRMLGITWPCEPSSSRFRS